MAVSASTFMAHPTTSADPCDSYGDCLSSSISYIRSNPDRTLYLGDSFVISLSVSESAGTTTSQTSWSYDPSAFLKEGSTFAVIGNVTGMYTITASTVFSGLRQVGNTTEPFTSALTTNQSIMIIPFAISFETTIVNVTGEDHNFLRNPDGSFYRNDSFCAAWNASFEFSDARSDIKINVTSVTPGSLRILNYSADSLGRSGRFCYAVASDSTYGPYDLALIARALNWQGVSLGLRESGQPFAVVQYNPQFTSYAYMLYRNSTASSSLQRPWVLLVRYDGNLPGYSYLGDRNTHAFNGSRTLAERAYFSDFRFSTLSYQPYTSSGGVFEFHVANSSGTIEYNWLNRRDSSPLYYGTRVEKFVFNVTASSLTPLLSQAYVFHSVTMTGCWNHESACDLRQSYWLVPFLWNGRLNIVSVDANGNRVSGTPISLTISNPSPLDGWLVNGFEQVFGNDRQALSAFEADLYPTNQTLAFSGSGRLSVWFNQTSLSPPMVTITAGSSSLSGRFTFVPVLVNSSTIASIPNSLTGSVYYANATIPAWSYNMVQGSLSYFPVASDIGYPSTFLELMNSSMWVAGNTTAPQTPSAFASQEYGFWPLGENLTVYVNLQGGGIKLLGTQKLGPNDYRASFYVEPWSGGISSVQLVEGNVALAPQTTVGTSSYPSPLPPALTGLYSLSYPATGQDTKVVFTNVWGATTAVDLGTSPAPAPLVSLIPATTVTAFGIAFIIWFIVSGVLKTRRASAHE